MSFAKARHWRVPLPLALVFGILTSLQALAAGSGGPMKPVIAGFIDMQDIDWHNADYGKPTFTLDNVNTFPGVFGGIVLNATWWQMQREPGGALVTGRIDRALNEVRRYNAAHPTAPLGVKLRIFAGNQAPAWAKAINGGPLTIKRNPQGCHTTDCRITIGKVWDPDYIAAWREFQGLVAERYDSEPLIRSVAITSCTMETDEPFVMPIEQRPPSGYTDGAGKACLRGALDDYAAWKRTPIDFTINSFHLIRLGGFDPDFSIAVMTACRAKLGKRCELGNHAFSAIMPAGNAQIVAAIAAKGPPIHYQTVGPKGLDWTATVVAARKYRATALELWPHFGGFTTLTPAEMQNLKSLFMGPAR